ncbi:adenylyl-sulfate kinase [Pseudoduganella violacea]|uniref:Adenylyl-sulfate kinase n=1 Tax=Pseudoduganella violacea TaxID=1715466 RepID=A0A7W5BBY3_9BURK|nr:adenylyl-sulfate kinase [Pseudoduganella violacea]MBB3120357.1 adenylylsulfate kinase [Pseudoduganella violacea]
MTSSDIVWQYSSITRAQREQLNNHRSAVVWFTGLSGSGKSSVARAVEARLFQQACRSFVLDGDNVRHGLCSDLGFAPAERSENIRRAAEAARLFSEAGMIVLAAFISPFRADRERARALLPAGDFLEVYCRCSVAACEERDVKGLYRRARAGEIADFTGISSPYEEPTRAELVLDTCSIGVEEAARRVLDLLREHGVIAARHWPL